MQPARRKQFTDVLQWFAAVRTDGLIYGPELAALPARARRTYFQQNPHALGIGTLEYLLDTAHQELDHEPRRARELTTFVLEYLDVVTGPAATTVPVLLFRARAWKEHANALYLAGDLQGALAATAQGIGILADNRACYLELSNIRQLEALIRANLGENDEALRIVRANVENFLEHRDMLRYVQARLLEGWLVAHGGDYARAAQIFEDLLPDAAALSDQRELTRLSSNLWQCAVKLKDPDLAHRYYARAAEMLDETGMTAEKSKLRWGFARALAQQGNIPAALREFAAVQEDLLRHGMVVQAANAALETLELLHQEGRTADAQALAVSLVDTFGRAGLPAPALQALAFLKERAVEKRPALRDIKAVREHLAQLELQPDIEFLPPRS